MEVEKIDPIQYFKDLLRRFDDAPNETYWGKAHNATSRDMISQAIAALERQRETEQMAELKPCPLCGGNAKLTTVVNDNYISCSKCGLRTHSGLGVDRTARQVTKVWNTRTEPEPRTLMLEDLWKMNGKPVWLIGINNTTKFWAIVRTAITHPCVTSVYGVRYLFNDYGKTWFAYDREPRKDAKSGSRDEPKGE